MIAETMPNLTESEITDLWRFRQEHDDAERYHKARRTHADKEVLRRSADLGAQILGTDHGDIVITFSSKSAYNRSVVDGDFFAMIQRDGIEEQWNQFVQHSYKIDKRWLNRLKKRGQEYIDVIERMTTAATGSPKLEGPTLADMGGYAETVEEVATP